MGFSVDCFSIESLIKDYDALIDNFRKVISDSGAGANIESTKLWKYRKELECLDGMENRDVAALLGLVRKYCSVSCLFDSESGINLPNSKLLMLLEGDPLVYDKNQNYNDAFFEVSMAIRLAKGIRSHFGRNYEIDMTGVCDVVLVNEMAVECKYVHSLTKVRKKISEGISQIKKRVADGVAPVGMVALDISNLVNHEKIYKFSQEVFSCFLENHKEIMGSRCVFAGEMNDGGVIKSVLSDGNFSRILNLYAAHEAETVFYKGFTKEEYNKLDKEVIALAYQANYYLCLEYKGEVVPVPFRSMGRYINKSLPDLYYVGVEDMFNSLAVGI
ncbi:hypothetical protein [Pectobacterium sp. IFB5596]|uniref:hypothetical protein n=1 Tax=Pectobacterium sp. IFB5596 TaxID=1839803 RepID=UPI001F2B4FC2|nr:hypothetical protein [Pectobacterium sp. IFB5596]MCE9732358.1 hypothetical protein [Pectobacterium sp. IFB5596]